MLKRLELVGFKSFADKTRFDFAPGITGVVGPNGSGKSNVVDAVRWILGEQSAKSLRGGEMADVIFNGSSSRKSLGLAEVTVTFDNARRLLAVDADEVQLTRRVYRDGNGEYLINGQMARLKDIKEMFLGSGAGADGYTIIAQGRVDELLQASTKDRREIFDEAAGISRFKAKKIETLRKLAGVEVNLTRSKDRLDALDTQLRTLRLQAAKAQKYKEYSDRLRDLRVGLGLREYRELSAALEIDQRLLAEMQAEVADVNRRTGELEQALRELDREVSRAEDGLRHQEGRLADAREQIAGHESTLKHERAAAGSMETELLRIGRLRAELGARTKAIEAESIRAAEEEQAAEANLTAVQQTADAEAAMLSAATERVTQLDRVVAANRDQQFQLVGDAAAARSTATACLAQVERLQKEYTRKRTEVNQAAARRATLAEVLDGLSRADADVQSRLMNTRERFRKLEEERKGIVDTADRVQQSLESLRVRQGDLRGRVEVLEDLDRTLDGIGAGARHVLALLNAARTARNSDGSDRTIESVAAHPAFDNVVGLVADLLTVPHELAPLVEVALGDTAQRFVVRSREAVDAVAHFLGEPPGRVGFLPLARSDESWTVAQPFPLGLSLPSPETLAGQVTSDVPGLADQLLGNVLLVATAAEARAVQGLHPGYRIVTRAGELFEPDGTLTIGPARSEAGLVSRKSELRERSEQLQALGKQIDLVVIEHAELHRRRELLDNTIEAIESEIALLSGEAGDLQQKIARQLQHVEQLDEAVQLGEQEAVLLEQEVQRGEAAWVTARLEAEEKERAEVELRARLAEAQESLRLAEDARAAAQEANTAAQVTLSRVASERDRARERVAQLDLDLRKRRVEAVDLLATDRTMREKLAQTTLALLSASAGQAASYREKEHRERLIHELTVKVAASRSSRAQVRDDLEVLCDGWQVRQAEAHAKELAVRDRQVHRDGILARIREDYGIDLAASESQPVATQGEESPAESSDQCSCPKYPSPNRSSRSTNSSGSWRDWAR